LFKEYVPFAFQNRHNHFPHKHSDLHLSQLSLHSRTAESLSGEAFACAREQILCDFDGKLRRNHFKEEMAREQLAELMRKILLGAFYALQGLGNLIFALFIFGLEGSEGAPGGGITGLEIMTKTFLEVVSCLSLLTALTLFMLQARKIRSEKWSLVLGMLTSVFFGLFYLFLALMGYSAIGGQYSSLAAIVLLLSLIILVLNAVSVVFLFELSNNK